MLKRKLEAAKAEVRLEREKQFNLARWNYIIR
jgi:hypothetical protein